MRQIEQFIWGFQPHFRMSVKSAAQQALRSIGAGVDPSVVLVGFRATKDAHFDYCIEPETEAIAQADLSGVVERASVLYEEDEESKIFNSNREVHEQRQLFLRDRARAESLCEALGRSGAGNGRTFFASGSRRIGNYDVYTVIGVVTSRWLQLPALQTRRRNRFDVTSSLAESVVREVLTLSEGALDSQTPPSGLPGNSNTQAIISEAARRFVTSVALLAGQLFGSRLYEHLDAVSAQPYEGRTGVGTIMLAARPIDKEGVTDVTVEVAFTEPVDLSQTRAFRKALEMSGPSLHVLCDGKEIYGLGSSGDGYDASTERVFTLTIVGRGSWELGHAGIPLLRVDNTRAILPKAPLSQLKFFDTVKRLFPESGEVGAKALWALAQEAAEQEHGTMLVVHRFADIEASRLVPQALRVEPVQLTNEALRAITNIDGAVLVSPDARCHAVGVILDGQAAGQGDPSRGARYNSAVRYRQAAKDNCLIIIVSEDGMINLLPDLNARVEKDRVERAVVALEEASFGDVNFEVFFQRREHLESLAFYLTAGQCDRATASQCRVEDYRWSTSQMRISHDAFKPNPDMDESYFL